MSSPVDDASVSVIPVPFTCRTASFLSLTFPLPMTACPIWLQFGPPVRSSPRSFRDGAVPTAGTAITRILPPASRFSPGGDHGAKKQRVLDKLAEFFDRYFGLV